MTDVIDVMEEQSVVVLDVPGAFMQAEIDELAHMCFTGAMVNMLLQIDYEMYKDYIVTGRGEQVIIWSCSRPCMGLCVPLICFGRSCPNS